MGLKRTGLLLETKRFAIHDGPGVRTTFFLKGCPLRCQWCHNPESISPRPQLAFFENKCIHCGECAAACPNKAHTFADNIHTFDRAKCLACGACEAVCLGKALRFHGRETGINEAVRLALEDRDFYGDDGGITLSGGEPLLQAEFCAGLLRELKQHGLHSAVDTCGCVAWAAFEKVLPWTDLFLFDLKHPDSASHRRLTGQGNELIIENLRKLSAAGARIEIRIPLIPGINDSPAERRATEEILCGLNIEKVRFLVYHDMARAKYASLGMPDKLPPVSSSEPEPPREKLS